MASVEQFGPDGGSGRRIPELHGVASSVWEGWKISILILSALVGFRQSLLYCCHAIAYDDSMGSWSEHALWGTCPDSAVCAKHALDQRNRLLKRKGAGRDAWCRLR